MKRDWKVIRTILEHIEREDLNEYLNEERYGPELQITEDVFTGHIEILADAGVIRNAEVRRMASGDISFCAVNGAFISMQGHDLLDEREMQQCGDESSQKQNMSVFQSHGSSLKPQFLR